MAELLSEFTTYLASPGNYSNPTKEYRARCLAGLKTMFDFYKRRAEGELEEMEKKPGCRPISTGPLSELYTEGLDMDQIWEQVELVNKPVIKGLSGVVHGLEAKMERGEFQLVNRPSEGGKNPVVSDDDDDGISSEHEEGDDDDEIGSDFRASDEDEPSGKVGDDGGGGKRSVVDDRFFKLLEMEKFLELAERDEGKEDSSSTESEEDEEGVNDSKNLCYEDFFDPPSKEESLESRKREPSKMIKPAKTDAEGKEEEEEEEEEEGMGDREDSDDEQFSDEEEEDRVEHFDDNASESGMKDLEEGEKEENLSKHQKKQLLLQRRIATLEEANLADKNWKMSGETTSKKRPLNSLLEEDLSFDHMSRPPLVVTEETTKSLEDLIKKRIVDEAWDDVERRVKPAEKPYDYSKSKPLNQEKSKVSLAEIYEQEYIKQTQESTGEAKEDKRHVDIKTMMDKLFLKLDALSNFHFTPKPPVPEVKIVTNVPAIQMEEVAPLTSSDATLLAPEEIMAKSKRPELGSTEKTTTDRKRERRLKKKQKRLKILERKQREKIVSKLRPGLGNKYSAVALEKKLRAREENERVDNSLRSSSKFFAQLQEQVQEQVQTAKQDGDKRINRSRTSVQQYKL